MAEGETHLLDSMEGPALEGFDFVHEVLLLPSLILSVRVAHLGSFPATPVLVSVPFARRGCLSPCLFLLLSLSYFPLLFFLALLSEKGHAKSFPADFWLVEFIVLLWLSETSRLQKPQLFFVCPLLMSSRSSWKLTLKASLACQKWVVVPNKFLPILVDFHSTNLGKRQVCCGEVGARGGQRA